jgi:hypothetical protein
MRTRILTASLLVLSLAGCGPFWVNPYVAVSDSPLNWMEIHYYNTLDSGRKSIRRVSVSMNGLGHIEVKKGSSKLVSDDFAKGYREEDWSDIRTQRMDIDPGHVHDVFQDLVNRGVLDREKWGRSDKKKKEFKRFIAVKANINNITYSEQDNIFEVDPDLAEYLLDTVRQFENPVFSGRSPR